MANDPILMLKSDHRNVEQLFEALEIMGGDRARLVTRLAGELRLHTSAEEDVVYPAMRQALPDGEPAMNHAEEEHREVAQKLDELERMDPTSDEAGAVIRSLQDDVMRHVTEEETDVFPRFRERVSREVLDELGDALARRKSQGMTMVTGTARVEMTKAELYEEAKKANIPGRSQMTKDELIEALGSR